MASTSPSTPTGANQASGARRTSDRSVMVMTSTAPTACGDQTIQHAHRTVDTTHPNDHQQDQQEQEQGEGEEEQDRDHKSWRTRGESSPSSSSLATPRSYICVSDGRRATTDPVSISHHQHNRRPEHRKRQSFWRNIVRQFNFTSHHDERKQVLSLTQGIDWMQMKILPFEFMDRHREIYYLISTGDYERSSMIQRDVTRTFSIFERSQLPSKAKDVDAQQRALFRVLNAVAEAEDGYCQGMNFIAALFLVEGLEEADAYALFLYLLKKRHLARIYHRSSTFLDDYLTHFEKMLQDELPDLYHHMQAQGFSIAMYGIEWFTTLFSLSTKPELACAIFDLFFVGVQDVFLRMGVALLKLLEAPLMCMQFEDFLRDFKPLVRQIDPYHAVLKALSLPCNPMVSKGEDTTAHVARHHFQLASQATSQPPAADSHSNNSRSSQAPTPPRGFHLHRTLPPELGGAIASGDLESVSSMWYSLTALHGAMRPPLFSTVLANEILHFAVWYGQIQIALLAIQQYGADVNNRDDTALTPLHFAVIRNQPELVRLLLCFGGDPSIRGGKWHGKPAGLTPFKTSTHWTKFRDTTAARLLFEDAVCLCCDTKFETFSFHAETCGRCKFLYCGRGAQPCIKRHQCPATYYENNQNHGVEKEQEPSRNKPAATTATSAVMEGAPTSENTRECSVSSSGSSSSRRSSLSETSSSFVYINSPASEDLPTDPLGVVVLPLPVPSPPKSSLLGSLVDWFGNLTSVAVPPPPPDDGSSAIEDASKPPCMDFPLRPDWYCNAAHCHTVFTLFSRAEQCDCCRGWFCGGDWDSESKRCMRCLSQWTTASGRAG